MYNTGEMQTYVTQRFLHHLKRTGINVVTCFLLFIALNGLTLKGVQAQVMQEPLWPQRMSPRIHLELDPHVKITANIPDETRCDGDATMPFQETTSPGKTDSAEEIATTIKEDIGPDWSGLKRDSLYFVGYQVVVVGILYLMPEKVSNWSDEQKHSFTIGKWVENVAETGWDEDDWYLNYIFHPYWGATYYIRARERGLGKFNSFLYSAFLSTLYEFGVEALFEPPSVQDLIVTPCAGSLLGLYFEKIREKIKAKGNQQKWYDKVTLVLTDPLGTLSKYTDRLLGINGAVELKSFRHLPHQNTPNHVRSNKFDIADKESKPPIGFEVRLAW